MANVRAVTIMFQIIPPHETRFWRIFRRLLVPNAVFSGLVCLFCAIAAACGEKAVFSDNRPVVGAQGVLLSIAYFPAVFLLLTLAGSVALFMDRRVLPGLRRVLFFWRRKP
jgi:hypothetical protein